MNKISTEMEFSGDTALRVQSSNETSLVGEFELSWGFLSTLADNYLKANRGRRLNPDHYKQVLKGEIEKLILEKAKEVNKPILEVIVDLPQDAGIHSKSIKAKIVADWYPELPEVKFDDVKIEQYKLNTFTEEEINQVKDQFLDSNMVPTDWDEEIQKGDIVRILWKWKIGDNSDWLEETSEDSASLVKIGVNPRLEPALENKLIGSKKGSVIEHSIKVPNNINEGSVNPEFSQYIKDIVRLAGKSVQLRLEVMDVQRPQRPVLDETLLKKYNLETEAALEERIKENLNNYIKSQNAETAIAQILDYLRKYDITLPDRHVEDYARYLVAKFANLLHVPVEGQQYQLDSLSFQEALMNAVKEEFKDWKYNEFEDFMTKIREVSKGIITGEFMINQVIKFLELPEDELQRKTLQAWLTVDENTRKRMSESQIREYFKNSRARVAMHKLTDLLREQGKIEEIELSSLKDFEQKVTSLSDDSLHTKYFNPTGKSNL